MKNRAHIAALALLLALAAVLALLPLPAAAAAAEYQQEEARSIFRMLNDFRASKPTRKKADGTQETVTGLKPLRYSFRLEEIAKDRAEELTRLYSKDRPNGQSALTLRASDGTRSYAENIAAWYAKPEGVFQAWREDESSYDGQEERRNMLGNYETVGMACIVLDGRRYWVQEFGRGDAGGNPCADGTHRGGTEVWGAVAATEKAGGYSGETICLGCGAMLKKGAATKPLPEKPAAPDTVTATGTAVDAVTVNWSRVNNADYYQVWRMDKKGDTPGVRLGTYGSGTLSAVSDGLKPGTTYYYRVRAYRKVDGKNYYSPYSATKAATTLKVGAPGQCQAKATGVDSVKVQWSRVSGVSYYQIWRLNSKNEEPGVCVGVYDAKTLSATNSGLRPGTNYYYRVRAYRTVDGKKYYGGYSSRVMVMTKKIGTPTKVAVAGTDRATVRLTWSAAQGADCYQVWRMDQQGATPGVCIGTYDADTTTCQSRSLKPGTTYYYRVRAYKKIGEQKYYGSYSATVSATTKK